MSEDFLPGLPHLINESFSATDSAIVAALPEKDAEYAELAGQKQELAERFPEIERWLEGSGPLSLTGEEHAGLVEYMDITMQMEGIERLAVYYAGHRDCFMYLKKIGAV